MKKTNWKFDGSMSVYENTGNPAQDRKVLEVGPGLGKESEKIGKLAAAAPELLETLQEFVADVGGAYGNNLDAMDWPDLKVTFLKAKKIVSEVRRSKP